MQHANRIERYPGTLAELAEELGNLRYDALAEFLAALSEKIGRDAEQDAARRRKRLAAELQTASRELGKAAGAIERAWTICEPRM
jgi:hypothetical protein